MVKIKRPFEDRDHINGKPRGDVTISVTNQEITLTDLNARKFGYVRKLITLPLT